MQLIYITRLAYSWAYAGPLTRIDFEPEILMTYAAPYPGGPVYLNDEEFNQPAPLGYGTRALIFYFAASSPTLAHTLTIDLDGVCTVEWMG
jgi:hypothetical protein